MKLALSDYRLLGQSGLRVSPLCLGTMTFGTEWGWGAAPDECRALFDRYLEGGGNFVDTANKYTDGASETILGQLLADRRDRVVLATKYSLATRPGDPNSGGNHRKNMVQSLEASLRRLDTDRVDLYWLHAWEGFTPIAEVMRGLDDLVRAGKVLYVGISDTPAWKIAQGNTLAELRGWTSFVAVQAEYNLLERTAERDLLPMARELGLGLMPWSPLASGILTGKYGAGSTKAARGDLVTSRLDARAERIVVVLREVAAECGCSPAQAALRWIVDRPGVASTLVGATKASQLEDNLGCLEVELGDAQRAKLDEASKVDLGFPHEFIGSESVRGMLSGGARITRLT